MPKISKLINVFKSCVGKGSNTKECKTVPDVFHDLCVSINNSLNSKNNKDVSFDTVDSPENKSTLHHVTDLADLKELLQKNIDPNIQDENGNTALEVTCNFEIAKMLLEYGATVDSKQQMGKILHHCGHKLVKNKIILSLLMHNTANTDFTKANLVRQCKEPHEEAERLIKRIEKIEGLIHQSKEVETLRVLQNLKNKYEEVNQDVSKIILDYIENQESDSLKAKLVTTCQNLGLIEDYSEIAQENALYKCLDEAFDLLDQGLIGEDAQI
ncbi:MAG: ankyrin repeat domain-containing protein [Rickettsia endosymbiont of Sceptobius lativentris]|nr:ankyrin repeat domain-containing protein [Rickettsia endosymbiont of Sceptobius lativentris]